MTSQEAFDLIAPIVERELDTDDSDYQKQLEQALDILEDLTTRYSCEHSVNYYDLGTECEKSGASLP